MVRSPVTVMGWIHCQEVPPNYLLEMCVHSQDLDEAGPVEMATLTSFGSEV